MTEAIEPTKKKKKRTPQWISSPPPSTPRVSAPKPSHDTPVAKTPGAADSVRYGDVADDNVFLASTAGADRKALPADAQNFLDKGGDKMLADLDISDADFARWIETGEESDSIRAAREKMQSAKSDIRKEMKFFQAALPVYTKAAEARGDNAAAKGAEALRNKIGTYEHQAYRLWIDSTKANVSALRTMASKARNDASTLRDKGDAKGAQALMDKADGYEKSAAKQSDLITKTLVVRKEAVKAQIQKSDHYDQRKRSAHTAYSDEIAELRTDDGVAEADAMERHVERSRANGYDPMIPQSIPSALSDSPPKGAFIGGAQHYLDEAEKLDFRARDSAAHLAATQRNGQVRTNVATRYLALNGYPPTKGAAPVVTPQTKGLMKHKVDGLLTAQGAATKRIDQLESKAERTTGEQAELNGLRKDVMDLTTKIEATKQELSAQQMTPGQRDRASKALADNITAAGSMKAAANDALADLDKRRDEINKYEKSDPEHYRDFQNQYAALRAEAEVAQKNYDDAVAAAASFDLAIAGSDPDAVKELANVGAGVIVEGYGPREPPGTSTDMSVIAGGGYDLSRYGPSTQDVLAPGIAAADKVSRASPESLETKDKRANAFDDAEVTANFYATASTLSKRGGQSTSASKALANHAVERVQDVQTVLDAAPKKSIEKQSLAKRAVSTGANVAAQISVDSPTASRALLRAADRNVAKMAPEDQAEGHVVVGEGAAMHATAIAGRRPPPKDDAYDQAVVLGREMLSKDKAPTRELAQRWETASERFDYVAKAPERHAKMIKERRAAANRAKEIALAKAKWLTREGKSIADGSISYMADLAYYGSGPLGWALATAPSESLDSAAGDLTKERVKWIEDGYAKEMAALDGLEELSKQAERDGRRGEFAGALASGDEAAIGKIAGASYSGRPPIHDVVRFVEMDRTALGSTLSGKSATLDSSGATGQLTRQTEATNQGADRAVGEAATHLDDLQRDNYFKFVPGAIAIGETAVEMIVTGGLSSSASLGKVGLKGAALAKRGLGAGRLVGGLQKIGSAHAKLSKASVLYGFGSKAALGYGLMKGQQAVTGELQGKFFKKGSFGEKTMNAGIGLVGDVGSNRIAGMTDLGRKMIMPTANIVATMGVVPYMQSYGGWSEADAKRFTSFVEAATVVGGAAHGTYKDRSGASPSAPGGPTPDSVTKTFDQRVAELKAKHPDIPTEVVRARAHREVKMGIDTYNGDPSVDTSKLHAALDVRATEVPRKQYATATALDLSNRAALTPSQAELAKPTIASIVEAHQKKIDGGEAPSPDQFRASLETELGKLRGADGQPLLSAEQSAQIVKTAVVERTAADALAAASKGTMRLDTPEQLKATVDRQEAALVTANEGRVPPLFSTAEIASVKKATVASYLRNRAADRAGEVADARKRPPSGRESVALVREEAVAAKKVLPTTDVDEATASMAIDVASGELASTKAGRTLLSDPARAKQAEARVVKRAVELGAKPGAVQATLDRRAQAAADAHAARKFEPTDSIVILRRVEDASGKPIERDGGWVFEESAGHQLLSVNEKTNTAVVRDSDGRVRDVSLDDVVFEHNGVTFGSATPLEMQRLRERYDALSPSDQKAWQTLMGEARKVSPEHAALARRMFASGESVGTVRSNFDRFKSVHRQDLAKLFSMEGHVQHYKDSCAAAGGAQTPLGWLSPMMGEAITKYPTAVAEQQRRDLAHAKGSSEPREGTPDYTGRASLDPNAFIPAPAGTASGPATAALYGLNPHDALTFDRHDATRLDPHQAPQRVHELLAEGHAVYVTTRSPDGKNDVAVKLTGPHPHPDGAFVRVRAPGMKTESARLEVRYVAGRAHLTLGGKPVTAVAVPAGAQMRGTRQGMFFTEGRHAVRDLEKTTGKIYERRYVADLDGDGNAIPDPARTQAAADQTMELAKSGYPVLLEVEWEGGGRHQIAVKPGVRQNADGQTEMFVHDPWVDRGRWMTRDQLAAYQLSGEHGQIVVMGVPEDTPIIGNYDGPEAHADSIPAPPPAAKPTKGDQPGDPLVEQKGWTDEVLSRKRFWSMYPNRDLRKQTTLPADVALDLANRDGVRITAFEKGYVGDDGKTLGEIDVRTNYAIVEVTVSGYKGSKTAQMQDRLQADGGAVNPHGLPVIFLGGKHVKPETAKQLHAQKVYVARDRAEVVRLHDAIAAKANKVANGESVSRADDIIAQARAPKDFYPRVAQKVDAGQLSDAWGVTTQDRINGRVQDVYGKVVAAGPEYQAKLDALLAIPDAQRRTEAFLALDRAVTYGQMDAVFDRESGK